MLGRELGVDVVHGVKVLRKEGVRDGGRDGGTEGGTEGRGVRMEVQNLIS